VTRQALLARSADLDFLIPSPPAELAL
jgi:hypothetical protein